LGVLERGVKMKKGSQPKEVPNSKVLFYIFIFRAWRRDSKSGKIIWAKDYGYRAWRIPIYASAG
jgi:hypothetical protein